MQYIADLHLHSHYSRATSKNLNLDTLYQWARIKGINVIATGDFTHPKWFEELKDKLEPDGKGFFRLKMPPKDSGLPGISTKDIDMRFCLTTEISSIYKYGNKVRKNHNLVFAPDFDTVKRINARLSEIGNLASDGRPILGLPARDLLEIVLETSDDAYVIPAHVWTPWFSTLGSKAGYDSIEDCFRDLSDHIFALETGLSSDPEMNWKISSLDNYTLISNSDAHSPQKLGREATLFDTELSYYAMFEALKTRKGYAGTYEFFPEEGKYHIDGHRKCGISMLPEETIRFNKRCPVCGKPLTIGVLHRVEELADRISPKKPKNDPGYHYLIPLPEMLSELIGTGTNTKGVNQLFTKLIAEFGNEFSLLRHVPVEDIQKSSGKLIAEAIRRVRSHEVNPVSGYDGEFGNIKVFNPGEIAHFLGQTDIFQGSLIEKVALRHVKHSDSIRNVNESKERHADVQLYPAQLEAVGANGNVLVNAGPGAGKTNTLIEWVCRQINECNTQPDRVALITFTNKAAEEMRTRLYRKLGSGSEKITVGTFHAVGYGLLNKGNELKYSVIYDQTDRNSVIQFLFPELTASKVQKTASFYPLFAENPSSVDEEYHPYLGVYESYIEKNNAIDLDGIIPAAIHLHKKSESFRSMIDCYQAIAVDELQDINQVQFNFLDLFTKYSKIFAIGDPDQSIYGFRGSDVTFFNSFETHVKAETVLLDRNYRNPEKIFLPAKELIQCNSDYSAVIVQCMNKSTDPVYYFHASNPYKEAEFIIKKIYDYIGGVDNMSYGKTRSELNYAYTDIAVLYRTHTVGALLVNQLQKAGIPVQPGDGQHVTQEPPFLLMIHLLRMLIKEDDWVAVMYFLSATTNNHALEIASFVNQLNQKDKSEKEDEGGLNQGLERKWNAWFALRESLKPHVEKNAVAGIISALSEQYFPVSTLSENQVLKLEMIKKMVLDRGYSVDQLIHELQFSPYLDTGRIDTGGVRLLTFHACKGLEFPVVFIAGMEDGICPINRKDVDMEEERRLLYVAMTRAAHNLYFTWADERQVFGRTLKQKESRFLSDVILKHSTQAAVSNKSSRTIEGKQLSLF